jgi:hypothetical protein
MASRALILSTLLLASPALAASPGLPVKPARVGALTKVKNALKKVPTSLKVGFAVGAGVAIAAGLGVDPSTAVEHVRQAVSNADPLTLQIAGGVLGTGSLTTGIMIWRGKRAVAGFEKSAGGQHLARLDGLRESGSSAGLADMIAASRSVQDHLESQLASAKASGTKKVGGVKLAELEKEAAFAGLAEARAQLALNTVAADGQGRLGGSSAKYWQGALAQLDGEATRSGNEGALALKLRAFGTEVTSETHAVERMAGQIKAFDDRTPMAFSGKMKKQSELAKGELSSFEKGELAEEKTLYEKANGAMRGRVSNRLTKASPEFKQRRERHEALTALDSGPLGKAAATAESIAGDLDSVISHRESEQTNLGLAVANEHVAVPKSRTHYNTDGSVNRVEHWTEYEDHSGVYRALAANNASAARDAADSADGKFADLMGQLPGLRAHATVVRERLVDALPERGQLKQARGNGAWLDALAPDFAFFNSGTSGAQKAAELFESSFLAKLRNVRGVVGERSRAEAHWMDGEIDHAIDGDIAQVSR